MRLRELQARFYDLVTAPEGVVRTLAARGEPASAAGELVVGDAALPAVARLDIYANMYFFRLLEVLRDDYAKVAGAVGDHAFHDLITDYLAACPPAHPSIAQAGARLPAFLQEHPLARERPWLPALARLERAHTELFDGPDGAPLTLDDLRRVAPAELMALVLRPVPCHRLLAQDHPLAAIWESPEQTPESVPETLLVWRQDVEVYHRPVDEEERALLALLDGQHTLQSVCEAIPGEVDVAAQALFNVLGRWVTDGLVERVR
jgi:hypothetical protein